LKLDTGNLADVANVLCPRYDGSRRRFVKG